MQVENVDVVKMKLKQARDRIKTFISRKNADIAQLDTQIQAKLPEYQQTNNKKALVPLLKAKKQLLNAVEQGETRLNLVNEKLAEVEMSQMNKEVHLVPLRPSKFLTTPTNIFEKSRKLSRIRTGEEYWQMLKILIRSNGLTIVRKFRRIPLSSRCGPSLEAISFLRRRSLPNR
jgi:hypothetical protein